jgi:hypothetical protein
MGTSTDKAAYEMNVSQLLHEKFCAVWNDQEPRDVCVLVKEFKFGKMAL